MPKLKPGLLLLIFFAIAGSCIVFYSNSLQNPFIWDDKALIVRNPVIRNWTGLPAVFTSDLYSGIDFGSNFYRPLQAVSYMWDYHFWQLNPYGYHLTNIVLHALVAFLVFLLGYAILKEISSAFGAALLFSVSPLHTEAVTYISGRADMLMGLFLLASLLLFIRGGYRFLAWLAFIPALLAKELAIVFPLVILAYLFYYRREELKDPGSLLKPLLPFLVIDFIYILSRVSFFSFPRTYPPALTKYPLLLRITALPEVIFTYLRLLFLPLDLHMSWTVSKPVSFLHFFLSWFFLVLICVACAYALRNRKNNKAPAFMLGWALIFFFPQSGVLPINAFIAEHFIYLSSISFFMLLAYLLHRYLGKGVFIFSIIGLVVFYGLLTLCRNLEWRSPELFYEKIIQFSPSSFKAHNNLGLQYEGRFLYTKAIIEYKKALEINPDLFEARSNLANLYFKMGKFNEARREYLKAEKNVPLKKKGRIEYALGCLDEAEGLLDEAMDRFNLALRLDPKLNFTHFNMARVYLLRGKLDPAAREILKSLPEISPQVIRDKQYLKTVTAYLRRAGDLRPVPIFYNNLGAELASQGFLDAAIPAFKRALELAPFYGEAHFNLGVAFWEKGLKKEAVGELKTAIRINPGHWEARDFLTKIMHKK
ncbi:MAG: tetratricopeptide repeat protein [Candidatus Omnitrophica bacterium]|nr:tetratricopeptide repeat protein [Candidatus Omnitrophota bacterium]MDD5662064.1 tetratricopeptide repeat protein [Candidatus Omnitrophota bacterium]